MKKNLHFLIGFLSLSSRNYNYLTRLHCLAAPEKQLYKLFIKQRRGQIFSENFKDYLHEACLRYAENREHMTVPHLQNNNLQGKIKEYAFQRALFFNVKD